VGKSLVGLTRSGLQCVESNPEAVTLRFADPGRASAKTLPKLCQTNFGRTGRPFSVVARRVSDKPQQMSSTTASQEELKAHRVPLAWRDQCSAYVVTSYSRKHISDPLHAYRVIPRLSLEIVLIARMGSSVLCAQPTASAERLPQGKILLAMGMRE
jgi:hypothetical protein